jgi:hypothetical protein
MGVGKKCAVAAVVATALGVSAARGGEVPAAAAGLSPDASSVAAQAGGGGEGREPASNNQGAGAERPELVKLKEIDTDGAESGPWVSADGLTLYWTVFAHRLGPSIWSATRPRPGAPFEKPRRLFSGASPTLSADGLVMVLNRRGGLSVSRRDSVDKPFPRPTDLPELRGEPYYNRRSCLSEDGLSLYFERLRGGFRGIELCSTRRRDASSSWERPSRLTFDLTKFGSPRLSCPFVFRNGSALLCADYRKREEGSSNFMVWTRSRPDGPFDTGEYVELEGLSAFGLCPRYVEATHELFFSTDRTVSGPLYERGPDLYVVRNVRLPREPK